MLSLNHLRNYTAMTNIAAGTALPAAPASLWETSPENSFQFPKQGKFIIAGVPGAFTPPCSSQIPGYINNYAKYAKKGIKDIYVVAVNDIFVVNAWAKDLTGGKESKIRFLSDSKGEFVKSLGLDFDASGLLGNHRSKRFVAVVENGTVKNVYVENDAPDVTVTDAEKVLSEL